MNQAPLLALSAAALGLFGFIAVVAGLAVYRRRLIRVYKVATLFKPRVIVANFRSMETILDASTIRKGPRPDPYPYAPRDLPVTYQHDGEKKDLTAFLERTWTTGFLVLQNGRIAYEEYSLGNTESSQSVSWSLAKSVISSLVGIAVHEGHIRSVEEPITDYVDALRGSGYEGVRIVDILQMSSGIRFNEDYGDFSSDINRMGRAIAFGSSLDRFLAALEREREPGTYHHYMSVDTQALGMLLQEATGETVSSYLESRIWQKVGMESDATWLLDGRGRELSFCGLSAVLRDFARIGHLYLEEGRWNGEQVVPADWVRASVTPDAPHLQPGSNPDSTSVFGYGYQWWIPDPPEGDFLGIGVYNQFIYVNPRVRVVIVKTSANPEYNGDPEALDLEAVAAFRAIANGLAGQNLADTPESALRAS